MSRPTWRLRNRTLAFDSGTVVMGILNVTPDSFSDGSTIALDPDEAVARGVALRDRGALIVDVGGESTRPYATPVSPEEETARVVPVVEALAAVGVVVSIDTMKPSVAHAAIVAGAEILNDVTGFRDPEMVRVAVETGVGLVAMHMLGTPQTMQDDPTYDDVVADIGHHLDETVAKLTAHGVARESIVVDPGIGFGKTLDHNLELLHRLGELTDRDEPLLIGVSRKGFVGAILEASGTVTDPADRDLASAVVAGICVRNGAAVVRAHDVAITQEAVAVADAIVRAAPGGSRQRSGDT